MTQAFCHLVLHYSVARLSWRTVKSLRRSRTRLRDGGRVTNDADVDVSPVEYEVLKGWTILAFHSLYVATGTEYFVRFFIPFYFHLKMIALIVTFVVPAWAGRGGGRGGSDFGLSPVISYWFDYLIVPGVHRVHEFVGNDPKKWALQQLSMVPWWFIDFFVLPGVLATEEEKQLLRKRRSEERGEGAAKVPPTGAFPPQITDGDKGVEDGQIVKGGIKDDSQSAPMDHDTLGNVSDVSFARSYRKHKLLETKKPAEKASDDIYATPPRGKKASTHVNEGTPTRANTSPFPRTTPAPRKSPLSATKKSFNSIISPVVKSRLASSAMRLKRFSNDYRNNGDLSSPVATPRKETSDAKGGDVSKAEATIKRIMKSPLKQRVDEDDDDLQPSFRPARRRRRERLSFGDHFRELVTGDANIRVRDHLFDLDLPTSPRRGNRTKPARASRNKVGRVDVHSGEEMDVSNITTRRSSRLAKKKVSYD